MTLPETNFKNRKSYWIDNQKLFDNTILRLDRLATESNPIVIGLDVETSIYLYPPVLALIQITTTNSNIIIDPFTVDISLFSSILYNKYITKVIHYANFEKSIFSQFGWDIINIFDTCMWSRKYYSKKEYPNYKHGLKNVALRELNMVISKEQQASDWLKRPLTQEQILYAFLDSELVYELYFHIKDKD